MQPIQLYYPMFAHVVLCIFLYALLTLFRAPSVWNIGARRDGSNPWDSIEKKVSANLSNQFEWPLFFYVICCVLIATQSTMTSNYYWLAWLFVAGRIVHSGVQISGTSIRLRGIVYTVNFYAVLAMWVIFLIDMTFQ